ncbi:hypothetical protein [Streptomyces murinus]|uniref:hypothetical protein n=1 Tax=Streptomyces murinus TaxID=33900 RepID=UPI00381837C6
MSDRWYPSEQCPHCDQAPTANRLDAHLATAHADLPDCTATLTDEDGGHTCAMKWAHIFGEYGLSHASVCGPMGRLIWSDTAPGATPHQDQP